MVLGLRDNGVKIGWSENTRVSVDGGGGRAQSPWFFATLTIHAGIAGCHGINLSHKVYGVLDIPVINTRGELAEIFLKGGLNGIIRGSCFSMGPFSAE